jgi:hypothetical protein
MRPAAEINDAAREAFVHRHIGFAGEGIFGMKARAVTADAALVAQRKRQSLAERDAAIFDGVVRVHGEVAVAASCKSTVACLANSVSMWSKNGMPVLLMTGFPRAVEVELDGEILVSLVLREILACAAFIIGH